MDCVGGHLGNAVCAGWLVQTSQVGEDQVYFEIEFN
jgi:hypothetical protein